MPFRSSARWGPLAYTIAAACGLSLASEAFARSVILNASYDVSRELYKDTNPAFIAHWKAKTGKAVAANRSHGGSSKQALSVIAGLEADLVTTNQPPDVEILVEGGALVAADWRERIPHAVMPYTTTSVFLVRKGNPKSIKDRDDLVRPSHRVIVPNPKTSGNGRYTYLAAWGYAREKTESEAAARDFMARLFADVPVPDGGGRGATTTFTQRGVGDVLVAFENEAILIGTELGADKFDIVYPSLSSEAAAPVAVVEKVVGRRGTLNVATACPNFLSSPPAQEIIAKHAFRPRDERVLREFAGRFPAIRTFRVERTLGSWPEVRARHYADGAIYDQISVMR